MATLERDFQASLIKKLERLFPGCVILKNDPEYLQGIPDLTILFEDKWAVLEVKKSPAEPYRPNQEWYLDKLDHMSFADTIYPENQDQILHELQQAFGTRRSSRVSLSQ